MTRFVVEILPDAEAEISKAFSWYFERSSLAADAFRTVTFQAIDGLTTDALMPGFDSSKLQIARRPNEIKHLASKLPDFCNGAICHE